jgi:hypothetical protein
MSNRRITQRSDAGVQYPPAINITNLAAQMNQQFNNVCRQLDRLAAQVTNSRTLAFNRLLLVGMDFRPLVKESDSPTFDLTI